MRSGLRSGSVLVVGAAVIAAVGFVPAAPSSAGPGQRVTGYVTGTKDLALGPGGASQITMADDGRFVAFTSTSTNLVPGTTAIGISKVFVRDLLTDSVELVSGRADGTQNADSTVGGIAITPDGRYVAFTTHDKLLPADTNAFNDVYRFDRSTKALELVSVSSTEAVGDQASGETNGPGRLAISEDGRYVAFHSAATNLVLGDTNGFVDIFRRDITAGTTARADMDGALQTNGVSYNPDMTADGSQIVFQTATTNFPGIDTNGTYDIWLRDFGSISPSKITFGTDINPNGASTEPSISDNGRYVAFASTATDLVAGDTNGATDVFVRDRTLSTTTRASVTGTNTQLNDTSGQPDISPDGLSVAFRSAATNAVVPDANSDVFDVFIRQGTSTTLVTRTTSGAQVDSSATNPSLASSGVVAWISSAPFTTVATNGYFSGFVSSVPFIGPHATFEDFFAHQLKGFTGAAPAAAVSAAAARMRAGASPERATADLARAATFSGGRAPVIRLYWSFFKRRPDLAGLQYWIGKYSSGALTLNGIAQKFAQSPEFKAKYGNTTNSQFVTLVYQNVLDRNPDAAGLAFWVAKLAGGTSRGQVMTSFSESPEGRSHMAPQVETVLLGLGMLGAIPSQALFDGCVDTRKDGYPMESIVDFIAGAPEYAAGL